MKRFAAVLILVLLVPANAQDEGKKSPYPTGSTSQKHSGLKFQLVMPSDYDPNGKYGLMVVLHGAGGTETGMAGSLAPLAEDWFIVCAPKSRGQTWSTQDLADVKNIIRHLMDVLAIEKGHLHGMGFSNGGWNLAPVVFDEKLEFASACWMAAGYNGGKVPARAKKAMGAIALSGAQDGNRGHAEKTVDLLRDKVRTVECRIEPDLGHKFTRKLMPYYFWWVKVMDGRFEPGDDMSFDWRDDLDAAKADAAARKTGTFLYFYSEKDDHNVETKRVQRSAFFDPMARHFGTRVACVKLVKEKHEELFKSYKLKSTPAIVTLDKKGKKKKILEGKKIKGTALAKALRSIAKDQSMPK
jgi:predicted esterase